MSEGSKMGLVIAFVLFSVGIGMWLGACALFVLTGN